jgi:hypothetical protein
MTSPDGITWTAQSAAGDNDSWRSVVYGNGLFVAVAAAGTDRIMTSPDGVTWTARGTNDGLTPSFFAVTFGNGRFVAFVNSSTGARAYYSLDGITWQPSNIVERAWEAGSFGNGIFVALACSPSTGCSAGAPTTRVAYSTDGIN